MPRSSRSKALLPLAAVALLSTFTLSAASDSALVAAIRKRDAAAVQALLKQGVNPNTPQGDGSTPLHWAAHADDAVMVDLLIRAGARANVANDTGFTAVHVACVNRNGAIVERLLAAGALPNAASRNGETVLMTCARTGTTDGVRALLSRGARVNDAETAHGQTALMWAASQGHPAVVKLLADAKADLGARSRTYSQTVVNEQTQRTGREELNYDVTRGGMTALLFTARTGDAESARILIEAGADPNDTLPDGTSAIVLAAYSGRTDVGRVLLDKGANPNAFGTGYTALHAAILKSDVTLVKALLAYGADPNVKMTKGTPMRRETTDFNLPQTLVGTPPYLLAARFLEPEIVSVLAAGGADTKARTANGTSALMLAAGMGVSRNGSRRGIAPTNFGKPEPETLVLATVKAALEADREPNATNQAGDTALHAAAQAGFTTVVQYLVDHGADVNAKNKAGRTPLAAALQGGRGRRGGGAGGGDQGGGEELRASPTTATVALLRTLGGTE